MQHDVGGELRTLRGPEIAEHGKIDSADHCDVSRYRRHDVWIRPSPGTEQRDRRRKDGQQVCEDREVSEIDEHALYSGLPVHECKAERESQLQSR